MDTPEDTLSSYERAERVLESKSYYIIEIDGKYLTNHLFSGYILTKNFLDAMEFNDIRDVKSFMKVRYIKGNIREVYAEVGRRIL